MCAILDANVIHEVFGSSPSEAGKQFLKWITDGNGRIVVSEDLLKELLKAPTGFVRWAKEARRTGKMIRGKEAQIKARSTVLHKSKECKSNDHHIIALAQVSSARLLYSRDRDLHQDFKNKQLIDHPRGRVYSRPEHKHLLTNSVCCA